MSICLAELILTDIFYDKTSKEIMDDIADDLESTFRLIALKKPFLDTCKLHVDFIALRQVLSKFTRDVFGQQRFKSMLEKIPDTEDIKKIKEDIIKNVKKFGFKINSFDPYIYRRVGWFFYWVMMLKPFHLETGDDTVVENQDQYITSYINEICAFILVKIMLNGCIIYGCKEQCPNKINGKEPGCSLYINLDDEPDLFQDFLYSAHFRKLTRSSLELFFSKSIIVPHCPAGDCPLASESAKNLHLLFSLNPGSHG